MENCGIFSIGQLVEIKESIRRQVAVVHVRKDSTTDRLFTGIADSGGAIWDLRSDLELCLLWTAFGTGSRRECFLVRTCLFHAFQSFPR